MRVLRCLGATLFIWSTVVHAQAKDSIVVPGPAVSATAPAVAAGGETLLERVAAVVDGRPILYSEIKTKVDKGPLVVVTEFPLDESAPAFDRAIYRLSARSPLDDRRRYGVAW